jgi:hypothetical protein
VSEESVKKRAAAARTSAPRSAGGRTRGVSGAAARAASLSLTSPSLRTCKKTQSSVDLDPGDEEMAGVLLRPQGATSARGGNAAAAAASAAARPARPPACLPPISSLLPPFTQSSVKVARRARAVGAVSFSRRRKPKHREADHGAHPENQDCAAQTPLAPTLAVLLARSRASLNSGGGDDGFDSHCSTLKVFALYALCTRNS